jgi:hypothetical protein
MKSATFAMVALVLLAVYFVTSPAIATETILVSHDGVWWQSLSRPDKLIAVEGMLVGYRAGYDSAAMSGAEVLFTPHIVRAPISPKSKLALSPLNVTARDHSRAFGAFVDAVLDQRPSLADRTFGTMVDKIDHVYSAHPKLLKTEVSSFVECAVTSGQDCEALARAYEQQ